MKSNINNRKDIRKLITVFFEKLLNHEEFRQIFFEVAQIDILDHIETSMDFWESALFQTRKYKNELIETHLALHYKYRLENKHFDEWLKIFNQSVDEMFEGEIAGIAKQKAYSLATIIKMKIDHLEKIRIELNN